jgi:asparagine synthase (glutamine-hydrolysing)
MSQFLAIITGQPDSAPEISESDLGAALGDAPGTIEIDRCPGSLLAMKMVAPDGWRARDRQPSVDAVARLAVVGDCRLDNRTALRSALGLDSGAIDSQILLRGYERWGEGLPSHLHGDFAGIVWDWRNRKLLAFRDPLGVKPLFFKRTAAGLVVASDVELIGKVAGFGAAVDGHRIVEHLLWRYVSVDRTFWADTERLPGGHLLAGPPDSAARRRYWFPETRTPFPTEPEAMECLASVFKQSVERRLDGIGPVFVHLSGGLDSSSIVCAASEISRRAGGAPPVVRALSERFPGMSTDEGPFIRAVLDWTKIEAAEWNDQSAVLSDVERPSLVGPGMDTYRTSGSTGDSDIVAASGGHVLLSGQGGDQFGSAAEVVDDMIEREPVEFLSEALLPSYLSSAQRALRIRLMARALLPEAIRSGVRARRFRHRLPKWLRRQWHDLAANFVRSRADKSGTEFPDKIRRARWTDLTSATLGITLDLDQRAGARWGVEFRYPFLDRDLVMAMLSVPTEFWPRPETNARIHRRALSALLPPSVASRRTKAHFTEPFARRLLRNRELLRRLFHKGEWMSGPYVDRSEAQSLLHQALNGTPSSGEWMTWRSVWGIATLEAWLRRVSGYIPRGEELTHG